MGDEIQEHQGALELAQNTEIQKLGWLSSYSRQVLLSRHALRCFYILADQMARFEADPNWKHSHNTATDTLRLLRAANEVLSGANRDSMRISAPYDPIDRPVSFYLGVSRVGKILVVNTTRPSRYSMDSDTQFSVDGLATPQHARWIGQEGASLASDILSEEIRHVRKGVGLSNKSLGDERCENLVSTRLWPSKAARVWQAHELFAPFNSAHNGAFEFWSDWYQGFLDGKPLDWELQRRVALIPDEDWQKGPEHIARLIEEIRARFELEKRIKELETEKQVWQERARLGIGGNNPPEAIEDDRIVQEIIWAPIEELKAETQSETPDKSKVKRILERLTHAAKWLGEKIMESAIAATVGACFANPAKAKQILQQIIDTALNWLNALF